MSLGPNRTADGHGEGRWAQYGIWVTLSAAWTIFKNELLVDLRRKDTVVLMAVFGLLVLVVFNFAIDLRVSDPSAVAPGIFWAAILFAGMLGFGRAFALERDQQTLDGLLLAPVGRTAIFLAKLARSLSYMLALLAFVVPGFGLMYNQPVLHPSLWLAILAGTLGFATAGTLFAALIANVRARESLLPVLLLPTAVPVIIGSVKVTADSLAGEGTALSGAGVLVAFAAIYLALAIMLFPAAIEE